MNEKNDNASCLNEEPLITADQVRRSNLSRTFSALKRQSETHVYLETLVHYPVCNNNNNKSLQT